MPKTKAKGLTYAMLRGRQIREARLAYIDGKLEKLMGARERTQGELDELLEGVDWSEEAVQRIRDRYARKMAHLGGEGEEGP